MSSAASSQAPSSPRARDVTRSRAPTPRRSAAGCRGRAASSPPPSAACPRSRASFSGLAELPRAAWVETLCFLPSLVQKSISAAMVEIAGSAATSILRRISEHGGIVDAGVGELVEPRLAQHQRRGNGVLQADLRLRGRSRPRDGRCAAAAADCRAPRPVLDRVAGMCAPPVERAVEQRMDHEARRIGLERVVVRLPRSRPGRRSAPPSSAARPWRRGSPARRRSARPVRRSPFPPAAPTTGRCARRCRR